jgi:hypothetical protein
VPREGEHGDADVAEDEVFGDEIDALKELLRSYLRAIREVFIGIVGLTDAAKENGHNARHLAHLKAISNVKKCHQIRQRINLGKKITAVAH